MWGGFIFKPLSGGWGVGGKIKHACSSVSNPPPNILIINPPTPLTHHTWYQHSNVDDKKTELRVAKQSFKEKKKKFFLVVSNFHFHWYADRVASIRQKETIIKLARSGPWVTGDRPAPPPHDSLVNHLLTSSLTHTKEKQKKWNR